MEEAARVSSFPMATATYTKEESEKSPEVNLEISADYINDYFEQNKLTPLSSEDYQFSFNDAMHHYEEAGWVQERDMLGAGACDIATLIYRSLENFSENIGSELIKVERDDYGRDIMQNSLFSVRKIAHTPYSGMTHDQLGISSVSRTNKWNRDLQIGINSHFSNGAEVPADLVVNMFVFLDEDSNYSVVVYSNYSVEEIRELAK